MSSAAFTITSRSGPANALSTVRIAAAMLSLIMPPANALKALPRLIRHAENTTMPAATGVMAPMANRPSMIPMVPITPAKASPAVRLASPLKAGVRISSAPASSRQAPATDVMFAETNPKPQHPAIRTANAAASPRTLFAMSMGSTSAIILIAVAISIIAAPMATIATAAAVLSGARLPSRYSAPASPISIKLTPAMPAPPVSVSMALPICFTAAAITSSEALAITMLSAPFFIRSGFTFVFAISTSSAAMPLTTSPAPRMPSIMRSPRLAKIATAPAAISKAVPIALMATSIPPSFTRYLVIFSRLLTSAFPASFCAKPAATVRMLMAMATPLMASTAPSMSRPFASAFASGTSASAIRSTAAAAATNPPAPFTPPSCLLNSASSPVIPASIAAMCPTASTLLSACAASIFPSFATVFVSAAMPIAMAAMVPISFAVSRPVRSVAASTFSATTMLNNSEITLAKACTARVGSSIFASRYMLPLINATAVAMAFAAVARLFVVFAFVQVFTAPVRLLKKLPMGFASVFLKLSLAFFSSTVAP